MGFSMNEPIEAESGGMAVSLMPISDYGVNTYGLTIVSNPGFMQQKPEGDRAYGAAFTYRLRAIGIRDKPIAPGSPWQNGFAERLIGSVRRECVDHIVVLGEAHLRRILTKYCAYYNELRTHRSLGKDAPVHRAIQHVGRIASEPAVGGLHHHYRRI